MKQVFCPKCHKFVVDYIQDDKGTQIVKNGKRVGALYHGNKFTDSNGFKRYGMPLLCPAGHRIYIDEPESSMEERKRLEYRFGQSCLYHENPEAKCTEKQPCETCIVFSNCRKVRVWQPIM